MSHVMLESVIRMPFEVAMGDYFSRLQLYQRAQQALNELEALQAKLAEQHTPVAWLNEETGDVISSELKADAPEMLKGYDVPLYKHPDFSCKVNLDSSNHIADMRKKVKENHIADASKMVTPDGWQLVPIEPTDEMLVSGQEEWALGKRGAMEDCEESRAIFKAMLAAAPKYK